MYAQGVNLEISTVDILTECIFANGYKVKWSFAMEEIGRSANAWPHEKRN